ncbi:MAG TPA: hypothetical protein VK921_17540 [Anditalea sp.]|nr:hypothetical protein [Anditalea sp.]
MKTIIRNIIAVLAGIVIGSGINMFIVTISGSIIPPPDGADVTTREGLEAAIHLFEPQHYIMPFLAHAMGTLVGAFIAALIAVNNHFKFAMGIGVFFLFGGIAASTMIPAPVWFIVLDLVMAYIPMAYLGWLGAKNFISPKSQMARMSGV